LDVGRARQPTRALASWAVVLLVVGGAIVLVRAGAGAQVDVAAGDVARGERLYTRECVQCHGPQGRGGTTPDGRRAPAIDDVSIAYARLVLVTHRMPPGADPFDNRERPQTFDEQDMADVLAYMVERFGLEGDVERPEGGEAASGLDLYAQNCAACHGATGSGGVAGGGAWTPRIVGYDPRIIASAIRVGPFEMPRFGPEALDDDAAADIAAFLQAVEEEPGTLLFPGELNPVYASAFGLLTVLVTLALVLVVAGKPFWDPDKASAEEVDPG
jgi:ubiquinol-cytochrome c reductase cytochrome c subunit